MACNSSKTLDIQDGIYTNTRIAKDSKKPISPDFFLLTMWLTRASTLQNEGRSAFVGQVAQFNLTSEEEAYSFEGYVANIRDLGHDYPLALTPCREKAPVPA